MTYPRKEETAAEIAPRLMKFLVDWDNEEWEPSAQLLLVEALESYAEQKVKEAAEQAMMDADKNWKDMFEIEVRYARNEWLEKAAKICDRPVNERLESRRPGYVLADRIRALKSPERAGER